MGGVGQIKRDRIDQHLDDASSWAAEFSMKDVYVEAGDIIVYPLSLIHFI